MRRLLLIISAVLAVPAGPSSVAAAESPAAASVRSYTIVASGLSVSRIGAFRLRRDPTIGAAIRVFGPPSSRKLLSDNSCQVDWRSLRLRISFVYLGGTLPGQTVCDADIGQAQSFTARSSRFRTWRFLRVGARSSTVLDRHPSADFRRGGWWLKTAISPFGDESEYPVLRAVVSGGRVRALAGWVGAAGE